MGEIIDRRQRMQTPSNAWDSLMRSPSFREHAAGHLSEETNKWLKDELANINEDERMDRANPHKLKYTHSEEEYAKFRQEKKDEAIGKDLPRLDAKALATLEADLASIDEDEQRDYDNEHKIRHRHTRKEYDRFRQEAIAKAFQSIDRPEPKAVIEPESEPESEPTHEPEPQSSPEEQASIDQSPAGPEKPAEPEAEESESPKPLGADLARTREADLAVAREKEKALARAKAERLAKAKQERAELEKQLALTEKKAERNTLQAEQDKILAAQTENAAKIQEIEQALREDKYSKPLAAIDANFTHDKHELARDLAENDLNTETAKAKLITRLWKGTLFKKYYHRKYTDEYIEGKRRVDGKTVYEIIEGRSGSAMQRFVLGATEDMRYIHQEIGKKRKDGTYDGERLVPADEKTSQEVENAIREYAGAKLEGGKTEEDLKREFRDRFQKIKIDAIKDGRIKDGQLIDNYLDVAIQARERFEYYHSMNRVMEGFKVYNVEARDSIRTQAHRDNIDKITNYLESSKIGQFIPAATIAGAVSVASGLFQTGTRAVLGAAGGTLASSVISGLKERNRVTEDRARMLRDVASGATYEGLSKEKKKNKIAKYEARIGGTLYDLRKASELTENLEKALTIEGKGRDDAVLRAIAEARVRIDLSDSEQKDLIAYTSADRRGEERLNLDIATITAEKSLSPADQEKLKLMKDQIQKEILQSVDQKDADFRRKRADLARRKAGKTLLIGAASFFVSQEVIAAIDPNRIGLFEKAGLLHAQNDTNASETLLASIYPDRNIIDPETIGPITVSGDQSSEIARLRAEGYAETKISDGFSDTRQIVTEVNPASSDAALRIKYDGWANNGTGYSDGNELRAYLSDGSMVSRMQGISTVDGAPLDYNALAAAGRIKGYITLGDNKFEVVAKLNQDGQLTWGENGIFTLSNGGTVRAIGENGEKLYHYFEIAVDNGVDADGIQHIIPFATDVGTNSFNGAITQVAEEIVEHPAVYSFTKTIFNEAPRAAVTTAGIAFAPETARTGLGAVRQPSVEPEPTPASSSSAPATSSSTPETTPSAGPAPSAETAAPVEPATSAEQTPPTAPPSSESASAPESTPPAPSESESEQFSNETIEAINDARDRIGGQVGIDLLTDPATELNPENGRRLEAWWSSLDDNGKNTVRELMQKIIGSKYEFDLGWGRAARAWFVANHYM